MERDFDSRSGDGDRVRHPTPRWVVVISLIGAVLVVLLAVATFTGDSDHGPARHLPAGDAGDGSDKQPTFARGHA